MSEPLARRYARTVSWTVVARVTTVLTGLALVSLASRRLGADGYGVYGFLFTVFTTLALLGRFGLGQAMLRYVPELHRGGRRSLVRFLAGSAAALVLAAALVVAFGQLGRGIFRPEHAAHLGLVAVVAALAMFKEWLWCCHVARFRTRLLAVTSVSNGLLTLGLAAWLLADEPTVDDVFLAHAAGILVVIVVLGLALRDLVARTPVVEGIQRIRPVRLLKYCFAQQSSSLINLLRDMHSEVYFLGFLATHEETGWFQMGYWLPFMALSMIPIAIRDLGVSTFTEIQLERPERISHAMRWYYKLLITLGVPTGLMGFVFAEPLTVLFMGEEQFVAGALAAVFSLMLVTSLVYQPISLALLAREQSHRVVWVGALELLVNLAIDWVLITRLGLLGAVLAFPATMIVTLPFSMTIYRRLLGPLGFPFGYFARALLASSPVLLLVPFVRGVDATLPLLALLAAGAALVLGGIRLTGLIGPEEIEQLGRAALPGWRWQQRLLVRPSLRRAASAARPAQGRT